VDGEKSRVPHFASSHRRIAPKALQCRRCAMMAGCRLVEPHSSRGDDRVLSLFRKFARIYLTTSVKSAYTPPQQYPLRLNAHKPARSDSVQLESIPHGPPYVAHLTRGRRRSKPDHGYTARRCSASGRIAVHESCRAKKGNGLQHLRNKEKSRVSARNFWSDVARDFSITRWLRCAQANGQTATGRRATVGWSRRVRATRWRVQRPRQPFVGSSRLGEGSR